MPRAKRTKAQNLQASKRKRAPKRTSQVDGKTAALVGKKATTFVSPESPRVPATIRRSGRSTKRRLFLDEEAEENNSADAAASDAVEAQVLQDELEDQSDDESEDQFGEDDLEACSTDDELKSGNNKERELVDLLDTSEDECDDAQQDNSKGMQKEDQDDGAEQTNKKSLIKKSLALKKKRTAKAPPVIPKVPASNDEDMDPDEEEDEDNLNRKVASPMRASTLGDAKHTAAKPTDNGETAIKAGPVGSSSHSYAVVEDSDPAVVAALLYQKLPPGNIKQEPEPEEEDGIEFFEDDLQPTGKAALSNGPAIGGAHDPSRIGTISLGDDIQNLPVFTVPNERPRYDRNGQQMHANRVVSFRTRNGEYGLLTFQPRNNTTMPSSCHYMILKLQKDASQYISVRKHYKFTNIYELRSVEDPMTALSGNRKGKLTGISRKGFVRITTATLTQKQLRKWASDIAEMMSFAASAGEYDAYYKYVGDITPQEPQPLGYYLTMEDTFKVMQTRFKPAPLTTIMGNNRIAPLYFGKADLARAQREASNYERRNETAINNTTTNSYSSVFLRGLQFN